MNEQAFILAALKRMRIELETMLHASYCITGSLEDMGETERRRETYITELNNLHNAGTELLNEQSRAEYEEWLNTHESTFEWLKHVST